MKINMRLLITDIGQSSVSKALKSTNFYAFLSSIKDIQAYIERMAKEIMYKEIFLLFFIGQDYYFSDKPVQNQNKTVDYIV